MSVCEQVKQELSTLAGFSMPEYYWRISRKEGAHNRFYSKIEQVPSSVKRGAEENG